MRSPSGAHHLHVALAGKAAGCFYASEECPKSGKKLNTSRTDKVSLCHREECASGVKSGMGHTARCSLHSDSADRNYVSDSEVASCSGEARRNRYWPKTSCLTNAARPRRPSAPRNQGVLQRKARRTLLTHPNCLNLKRD